MRQKLFFMLLLLLSVALAVVSPRLAGQARTAQREGDQFTAVKAGLLIDGTGRPPLENAVVLMKGDRVVSVGQHIDIPRDARVLDFSRQVVIPGLIDTHVHLGCCGPLEKSPQYYEERVLQQLRQNLAFGVTTIFSLGMDREFVFSLRDKSWGRDFNGSRVLTAGTGFTAVGGHPTQIQEELVHQVDDAAEARKRVQELAARNVDGIKIYLANTEIAGRPYLPPLKPAVAAAIIDEAHKQHLRAVAHIDTNADTKILLNAGLDGITHIARDPYDQETLDLIKKRGTLIAPSLLQRKGAALIFKEESSLLDDDRVKAILGQETEDFKRELAKTKPEEFDSRAKSYEQAKQNLQLLRKAGVKLAVGSDAATGYSPAGLATQKEIEALVDAGLTPMAALVAATQGSAEWAGVLDKVGTIEAGKLADMVVLNQNPLANIRNTRSIAKIILAGRVVDLLAAGPTAFGQTMTPSSRQTTTPNSPASHQALVNQYCVGCHNDRLASGGFSWTSIDLANPSRSAEHVEKVIKKLRAGLMPPAGAPRPDAAHVSALRSGLEAAIDRAAAAYPFAGAPELHRMNRAEYRNVVRDVLGVDVDVSTLLPADEMARGFDNMADALNVTPALVQAYLRAASKISRQAVGDPDVEPTTVMYTVPKLVNQMRHVEGAPLGTRGGVSVGHTFPASGEYTFALTFYYDIQGAFFYGQNLPTHLQGQEIEVSIDGARAAIFTIDPTLPETKNILTTPRITVTGGAHRVSAAFIAKFDGPTDDEYRQVEQPMGDPSAGVPGLIALPHLRSMTVTGPFGVTGVSDTPSRRRIFTCTPTSRRDETRCAKQILTRLARQAYRRPTTRDDVAFLLRYYEEGRKGAGFDDGIRVAVQAILADPAFLFRLERTRATATSGASFRLDDLDLASRLSYFLWSSAPDDPLLTLASQGRLHDPVVLAREVRRMLADPRSEALVDNFAVQWLHLQNLREAEPDFALYPQFSHNLGQSMLRETKLLFTSLLREDKSILDLLTANYTFVDEVLARHYGIPNVQGSAFRRVPVTDPNRLGLLGHGSILTLTSLTNRTSPVVRGKYVMEVLLGVAPPNPPANVPALVENVENQVALPLRERLTEHRKNPACAACHRMMDPIGLALENFDAIGRWRTHDSGALIDPSGQLYDGTRLDGPVALRQAILSRADAFVGGFTESLLAYGLGRLIDYRDMPGVRAIERAAKKNDYRFSSFVLGVVTSVPFQMRKADDAVSTAQSAVRPKAVNTRSARAQRH